MKFIILLASVLGVVTNAQSLSMMMSLPDIELGSMSMEGIEFGTLQTAAKATKGPAAAKAGKGAKGPAGGKGGKAAVCVDEGDSCFPNKTCCGPLTCEAEGDDQFLCKLVLPP
jgi:hypothetical protein